MVDEELINILACPNCQGEVCEEDGKIVCKKCEKKYPIKSGIPVMLLDESDK